MNVDAVCSACRVDTGQCPDCGTFWYRPYGSGSKRVGVRGVDFNPRVHGNDTEFNPLAQLNVLSRSTEPNESKSYDE